VKAAPAAGAFIEENEMSSHADRLKRGAVLASILVSSYALFGQDAWAPEPLMLTNDLGATHGASAAGYYIHTNEPASALRWPGSWTSGSPEAGRPCSTSALPAYAQTSLVIERMGNYARCTMWITEGARLDTALTGVGSTAQATTLVSGVGTAVVQFPTTWTHDLTVAAETYCTPWAAPAGSAVGMIIARVGEYAKCIS
jgi:hypothetical protein